MGVARCSFFISDYLTGKYTVSQGVLPISVVIPTKNSESTIVACVEAVFRNRPSEVIVVDGNSKDSTIRKLERFDVTVISDEGHGTSYAHKLGSLVATCPYVAFVDSDIILREEALATMLGELTQSSFAGTQAWWFGFPEEWRKSYWVRAQAWHALELMRRKPGGLSACLIRRDVVIKVGFDDGISGFGDDFDFLLRLKLAGFVMRNSKATVFHIHRANLNSLIRQHRLAGIGIRQLRRKWGVRHAGFWPPVLFAYWTVFAFAKGAAWVIPYLLVIYANQSIGLAHISKRVKS